MYPRLPINSYSRDKVIQESNCLLIFHHSDGFSRRLLRADIVIDDEYNYALKIKSHEYHPLTGKKMNFYLVGAVTTELREKIEYLTALKKLPSKINHGYGQYMTDIGKSEIIIKVPKSIVRTSIHIINQEELEKKANPAEKELLQIYKILRQWIFDTYQTLKSI